MKKRLLIIFIAALFIIAFIPALELPADASLSLGKASPGCDAYDQHIALTNVPHAFDGQQLWVRAAAFLETSCKLPIMLLASADPRAPPA
jgi:hypothetical protein